MSLIESTGQGTRPGLASLSWTLGANFEELALAGSNGVERNGQHAGQHVTGNAGANLLVRRRRRRYPRRRAGADTLVGGTGADLLSGGGGADAFRFLRPTEDGDIIADFDGAADRLEFSAAGFGAGLQAGMDLLAAGRLQLNEAGTAVRDAGAIRLWHGQPCPRLGSRTAAGGMTQIALLRDGTASRPGISSSSPDPAEHGQLRQRPCGETGGAHMSCAPHRPFRFQDNQRTRRTCPPGLRSGGIEIWSGASESVFRLSVHCIPRDCHR